MSSRSALNAWNLSIQAGNAAERCFAAAFNRLGIPVQQNNADDQRAVDMTLVAPIELKWLTSPYPAATSPSGISNQHHVTLDHSNATAYDPSTMIWLAVDYRNHATVSSDTVGLFFISAAEVQRLIEEEPWRVYSRSSRSMLDKQKKVGINLATDCFQVTLPGMTPAGTIAHIREALTRQGAA